VQEGETLIYCKSSWLQSPVVNVRKLLICAPQNGAPSVSGFDQESPESGSIRSAIENHGGHVIN